MIPESSITIVLPCRNRIAFANEAIQAALLSSSSPLIVIDDQSDNPDSKYFSLDERIRIVYNTHKSSLTKLWNQGCRLAETDHVLLIGDKIRLTYDNVLKIRQKLDDGFAIVGTYGLGCFAFHKGLLNLIGVFDEGFTWGEYEDTDVFNRLWAANLGIYLSFETPYIQIGSAWSQGPNKHRTAENAAYYKTKWLEYPDKLEQLKTELNYEDKHFFSSYDSKNYKSWAESQILEPNLANHFTGKQYVRLF